MESFDRYSQTVKEHLLLLVFLWVTILNSIVGAVLIVQTLPRTTVIEAALRVPGVVTLSTAWGTPYPQCGNGGFVAAKRNVSIAASKAIQCVKILVPLPGDSIEFEVTVGVCRAQPLRDQRIASAPAHFLRARIFFAIFHAQGAGKNSL
jgi:hypothetical protein